MIKLVAFMNRQNELTNDRVSNWTRAFRGFKPLSNEEMETYIISHADLSETFQDFNNFFEESVKELVSQEKSKNEAKRQTVDFVRKRQSEIGLKPNCNLVKVSGIKQYLKFFKGLPKAQTPKEILLDPKTPFSNLMQLFTLLEETGKKVSILDKHFDQKGLVHLKSVNPQRTKTIRVLLGKAHYNKSLEVLCKAYSEEMSNYKAKAEFRLLDPTDDQEIHDRFLICEKIVYLTPPWNIIHKKLGLVVPIKDLNKTQKVKNTFHKYWSRARKIS